MADGVDIKIKAGHRMRMSVDPAYAEKCDDKVMQTT